MEKSQKKGRIKTRELTKNEKILLSTLGIIILGWLVYRFVIVPQTEKMKSLSEQKIEYQTKIDEMNSVLRRESNINSEWDTLHKEKEDIVSRYFPILDQAQIIYLLNELVENDQSLVQDLNFNRPGYEDIGGFQVKSMDISLPYIGNYDGVMAIISSLKSSPRKILMESLSMDKDSLDKLNGNINLKIYSLDGIAESDKDVVYIDQVKDEKKKTPFDAYKDFVNDQVELTENPGKAGEIIKDIVEIKPYVEKTLLDFEKQNTYFLPSQKLVKGNISQSTKSKSNKYSLRLEYDIVAIEEENRAYIDVSKSNINLTYPPNTIGLWVYSYNYSPGTVGIAFRGQMGEDIFVPLTEGIGWTGWKYIEANPPEDLKLYPLNLEKLYVEIPKDRDNYGVLLMDKLEAVYTRNIDEDGNDKSIGDFIFHVVKPEDTVEKISMEYYKTNSYKNEILDLNEMKSSDILPVGKVLVLKKR